MEEERRCIACSAEVIGPFQPEISVTKAVLAEGSDQEELSVTARSWICPGCGLVQWYAEDEDLDRLLEMALAEQEFAAKPGTSYERRSQMLRMLRRVRRM
jgi:uncharacterized protein with PIN domain